MYATWRSYMDVTNMGTKKEVLNYKSGTVWCRLSSAAPTGGRESRVVGVEGQLSQDYGEKGYHGARPALYQEGTPE